MTDTADRQMEVPPPLYRIHIKTGCQDRSGTFKFCLDHSVLGVGWPAGDGPLDWVGYCNAVSGQGKRVNPSVNAVRKLEDNALMWARDKDRGIYYLAQVSGPWQYLWSPDSFHFDVHNVRPAQIVPVGLAFEVPGGVLSNFIAGQALRHVRDPALARYSAALFGKLTGQPVGWRPTLDEVLNSLLDDTDLEDLLFVYFQRREGFLVVPGNRRTDTASYEYVMHHPDGKKAVVQCKRGNTEPVSLSAARYPTEHVDIVYVFSPTGHYWGELAANVRKLDRDDVLDFMRTERSCLPDHVEFWVEQALGPSE